MIAVMFLSPARGSGRPPETKPINFASAFDGAAD
jgi:hypothetical protein